MPQFSPGQSKNAIVPVTVTPGGLICQLEVFLGPNDSTKVATSGLKAFTSTGAQQSIVAPVVMPAAAGTYHVYLDVYAGGVPLAGFIADEDVVITLPVASDLLLQYQVLLAEAIAKCAGLNPEVFIMIPGYGLQYVCPAIPLLKELMTAEAISLGLISSSSECYFEDSLMYYTSTQKLIAPEGLPCPYCSAVLWSLTEFQDHFTDVHWEIITAQGAVTNVELITYSLSPEFVDTYLTGIKVTWRNNSSFSILGRLRLVLAFAGMPSEINQDATVPAGQSVTASFSIDAIPLFLVTASAELYLLPVMKLLDKDVIRS